MILLALHLAPLRKVAFSTASDNDHTQWYPGISIQSCFNTSRFDTNVPKRLYIKVTVILEQGNVSNEKFMERVARYECVYHRNS